MRAPRIFAAFTLTVVLGVFGGYVCAVATEFDRRALVGSWERFVPLPQQKRDRVTIAFGPMNASGKGQYFLDEYLEPDGQQAPRQTGTYQLGPPSHLSDMATVTVSIGSDTVVFHIDKLTATELNLGVEGPPNGYQGIIYHRVP